MTPVGGIGLGGLGAPMAACLAQAGHRARAYDIDPARVAAVARRLVPTANAAFGHVGMAARRRGEGMTRRPARSVPAAGSATTAPVVGISLTGRVPEAVRAALRRRLRPPMIASIPRRNLSLLGRTRPDLKVVGHRPNPAGRHTT